VNDDPVLMRIREACNVTYLSRQEDDEKEYRTSFVAAAATHRKHNLIEEEKVPSAAAVGMTSGLFEGSF
jgi:hypothetical protein